MEELKPCPFCGYENAGVQKASSGRFYVSCVNCDITFEIGAGEKQRIRERTVDAWNRRAD